MVYLVKFIKGMFKAGREFKQDILTKATAMTDMTIEQNYQLYFFCLKGYIEGKPNNLHKLVWHSLIENVVDDKSVCDDSGFEGMKIKDRCKLIGKEKPLSPTSTSWIEHELKPYFVESLKLQKKDLNELMLEHIVSGEITSDEAKPFFEKYKAKEHFFNKFNSRRNK